MSLGLLLAGVSLLAICWELVNLRERVDRLESKKDPHDHEA
jgi:hypothetical protein